LDNAERDAAIRMLRAGGLSFRVIGRRVGLSAMTCQRICKAALEPDEAAARPEPGEDDDDDEIAALYAELDNNPENRLAEHRLRYFEPAAVDRVRAAMDRSD
jgi:hypothetical protein